LTVAIAALIASEYVVAAGRRRVRLCTSLVVDRGLIGQRDLYLRIEAPRASVSG
jgi:hypothetical protein